MTAAKKSYLYFLCMLLVACGSPLRTNTRGTETVTATQARPAAIPTLIPTSTSTVTAVVVASSPAATAQPKSKSIEPTPFSWPPAPLEKPNLSRDPVTAAELSTYHQLLAQQPAARDDIALALAYHGLEATDDISPPAAEPPVLGARQAFHIRNLDTNVNTIVEAELLAASEHAYFWFDTHPGLPRPEADRLDMVSDGFDQIYDQIVSFFGEEDNPGIDGDPRIHIVHVLPPALCDVTVANMNGCRMLGVLSSWDLLPSAVNRYSNQREMFVMNGLFFDSPDYLPVLAHEFRHMVEANYDTNDWDWEVEGSAMLAKDLIGAPEDSIRRANVFLANPDQQLNRWTDGNTTPFYGQGYLLNRYIFDRLGPEQYLNFARHPAPGLQAIDELAQGQGWVFDGHELWLDWLLAIAIHDIPGTPEKYSLPAGITGVFMTDMSPSESAWETTVHQYAADYYRLPAEGEFELVFTGSRRARLFPVLPASGEKMWLANRANFSQMRLTREIDLNDVGQATLNYSVYHDIEQGYDFAYVSASIDGGRTWRELVAPNMRGAEIADNPGDSALTTRFYTGDSEGWLAESIDLSSYAGRSIQLRFEYVTDPILTFAGFAVDNISIPEIGFYDGAERDAGWKAEGFVQATGFIPQPWDLQIVIWKAGAPQIERLMLSSDETITKAVTMDRDARPPVLIVAASAPMTLEPAHYLLQLR